MSKEPAVTGTLMLSPGALQWPPLEGSVREDQVFYFSRRVMGWVSSYPTSCFLSSLNHMGLVREDATLRPQCDLGPATARGLELGRGVPQPDPGHRACPSPAVPWEQGTPVPGGCRPSGHRQSSAPGGPLPHENALCLRGWKRRRVGVTAVNSGSWWPPFPSPRHPSSFSHR